MGLTRSACWLFSGGALPACAAATGAACGFAAGLLSGFGGRCAPTLALATPFFTKALLLFGLQILRAVGSFGAFGGVRLGRSGRVFVVGRSRFCPGRGWPVRLCASRLGVQSGPGAPLHRSGLQIRRQQCASFRERRRLGVGIGACGLGRRLGADRRMSWARLRDRSNIALGSPNRDWRRIECGRRRHCDPPRHRRKPGKRATVVDGAAGARGESLAVGGFQRRHHALDLGAKFGDGWAALAADGVLPVGRAEAGLRRKARDQSRRAIEFRRSRGRTKPRP